MKQRVILITGHKRYGKEKNLGGVEKHSVYLEKAFKDKYEFHHYIEADYKEGCTPEELAIYLCDKKMVRDNDIIIGDSYFVSGYPFTRMKLISFFHGTWAEFQHNNKNCAPLAGLAGKQYEIAQNMNIKVVTSCNGVAQQVMNWYKRTTDKVILHGIDTDLFKPPTENEIVVNDPPLILYAAKDDNKGINQIKELKKLFPEYNFAYLNANSEAELANRFKQADLFLHLANYEGNAYSLLEAMATNLQIITTSVGLFNIDYTNVFRLSYNMRNNTTLLKGLIDTRLKMENPNHRKWILQNATFEKFKNEWINIIEEIK